MKASQAHLLIQKQQSSTRYNIETASTLPVERSPKIFKRRQDNKKNQMVSPDKKRKQPISSVQKNGVCYISLGTIKKGSRETSLQKRYSTRKQEGSNKQCAPRKLRISSSPDLNKLASQQAKNSHKDQIKTKLMVESQKRTIQQQQIEITQLKQINKILNNEIASLKNAKESQSKICQQTINDLTHKLKDYSKIIKANEKEIQNLRNAVKSQTSDCLDMDSSPKEELEKILNDINREIDEIFIDQVSVDRADSPPTKVDHKTHHTKASPPKKDLREIVYELENKIKYLQIEVGMLKKYKADYERMEKQWMIASNQLKTFKKKLIVLVNQTKVNNNNKMHSLKNCLKNTKSTACDIGDFEDSEISFEISQDSNLEHKK